MTSFKQTLTLRQMTMVDSSAESSLQGARIIDLRDLRGITQAELATTLEVTQSFISHVENGTRPLPMTLAIRVSGQFDVPLSFFAVTPGVTDLGQYTFRKRARASARDERRIKLLFKEAARFFFDVSAESGFRTAELLDPREYAGDPEECAEALRATVGLGIEEPVTNTVRLIERQGIGVITRLDHADGTVSDHLGISRPNSVNNRPLIATITSLPGAVQRLSLAHELGHLIFDRYLQGPITKIRSLEEARAFRFAGALLLPERVARKRITDTLSLHGYLKIKADYGISVPAILRRAKDLGIISPDRYRSLSIQLASQGWRTNEPVDVSVEIPLLLNQALTKVESQGSVSTATAEHYGLDPAPLARWIDRSMTEQQAKILRPTSWTSRKGDPNTVKPGQSAPTPLDRRRPSRQSFGGFPSR